MASSLHGMMSPQRESLELLLQGVIQDHSVYWKKSQDDLFFRRVISPYLLPIEYSEGMWRGVFNFDEAILSVPIGFSHTTDAQTRYFTFNVVNEDFCLMEGDKKEGTLYLPTQYIGMREPVGKEGPLGFTPNPGSPFQILGVSGLDQVPFILVYEKSGSLKHKGLYLQQDGIVDFFLFGKIRDSPKLLRKVQRALLNRRNKGCKLSQGQMERLLNDFPGLRIENPRDGIEELLENDGEWEKPTSIMKLLDAYVVGNASAKKAVAVSFAQYMTRKRTGDINIPRDHILLSGPEGIGKAYMLKLLAQKAKLPYQHIVWDPRNNFPRNFGSLTKLFSKETSPYGLLIIEAIDWADVSPRAEIGSILASSSDIHFRTQASEGYVHSENLLWAFILSQGQYKHCLPNQKTTRRDDILSNDDRGDADDPARKPLSVSLPTPLLTQIPIQMQMQALTSEEKAKALLAKGSPFTLYQEALRWRGYSLILEQKAARDLALTAPLSEGGVSGVMERCHTLLSEIIMDPRKYANGSGEIKIDVELVRQIFPEGPNPRNVL